METKRRTGLPPTVREYVVEANEEFFPPPASPVTAEVLKRALVGLVAFAGGLAFVLARALGS